MRTLPSTISTGKLGGDRQSAPQPALVFVVIVFLTFLLHLPLLRLPYFWDEAGYYVPAARDLMVDGSLIPHTTVSNAHPPLVMAWLALSWTVVGYAPAVTRTAMLVLAGFSLFALFRLAERVANVKVAIGSTVCTALYPVFFAQSSLAQVDLAAAGLSFWALAEYLDNKRLRAALWFCLAVLTKETAIITPAALAAWELLGAGITRIGGVPGTPRGPKVRIILSLLIPALVLSAWYTFHYSRTGYVFGNPEFFRYNVASTLNPLRFILAFLLRLWQTLGYMHLWLLTMGMGLAMLPTPLKDDGVERRRIAIPVQGLFLSIVAAYLLAMALIGGAVLARYMLMGVPLVILLAVSTLYRRVRFWPAAVAVVAVAFVAAWFWNPPYGFSPEDNLAYRDYILLHEDGERFLEARYPMARVLTAWPASDELTRPWLGYVTRPVQVVRIEDFSLDQLLSAAEFRDHFDMALVFSTKYEPRHPLLERWSKWTEWKRRFFSFHRDVPPAVAARILDGKIVFQRERKGQWISVIELRRGEWINAGDQSGPRDARSNRPLHQVAGVGFDDQPHLLP